MSMHVENYKEMNDEGKEGSEWEHWLELSKKGMGLGLDVLELYLKSRSRLDPPSLGLFQAMSDFLPSW